MIHRRFFNEQLAQASYLIACDHSRLALVIDPNRDVERYIEAAARENLRIVAVTETHIHADFVSGARELALRTGSQLYLSSAGGRDWQYAFAEESHADLLTDGSHFLVGDLRVDAVHTPGHTPEHMSFLVTDTSTATGPMGAFTGDFIFVGDVGRPDLLERAAGMEGTMDSAARQLFDSLRNFKTYPDYLQLWPGHGAGSACGKSLGTMPQTTLGYEKLFNWALAESDEAAFVSEVLAGQPEPPAYFAIMKRLNREGPPGRALSIPDEAEPQEIVRALDAGEIVVDLRLPPDYAAAHAKGTINLPANKSFLNWSGALLPYDRDLWFIGAASESARRELASNLSLIGIDRARGVYPSERLGDLFGKGAQRASISEADIRDVKGRNDRFILDVRTRAEFADGHIPNAVNIPLQELQSRLDEVPSGPVVIHCQGGTRSAIASSVVQKHGHSAANMTGGFSEWERAGLPVERRDAKAEVA